MTRPVRDDVRQVATSGPAFGAVEALGPVDWDRWAASGAALEAALAGAADLDRRVYHLYLPALFFCVAQARRSGRRPVLIGIQAPQGAGKTTLVTHLLERFADFGLRGAGVSIDDFYLTRAEQVALAGAHPGNPYLEHRGYPGTHDVALGASVLGALRGLGDGGGPEVEVPVYDKSAHGGRGDRAARDRWRRVTAPLDIVIVEGWMLGFTPVPDAALPDARLREPNAALAAYHRWIDQLDAFLVLRALDPRYVLEWRVEAEEAMKARGLPGLSREAIEDYVRRFLPAYEVYAGRSPAMPPGRGLTIHLDRARRAAPPPAGEPRS
ncbi:MAG: hypothetical protein R2752_15270 [Vicinamibacterales bacterium]